MGGTWQSCAYLCIPGFLLFSLARGVPSCLSLGFAGTFNRLALNRHSADSTLAVVLTLVLVGMPVSVCRNASLQFHTELRELMVMIDMCERTSKSGNECDRGVGGMAPVISGVFVYPRLRVVELTSGTCGINRVASEIVFQPLESDIVRSFEIRISVRTSCWRSLIYWEI